MAEYTYKKHDNGLTYRYRNGVIQDDVYNFELHLLQRIDQLKQELEIANEGLTVAYMSGASEVKKELNALKTSIPEIQAKAVYDFCDVVSEKYGQECLYREDAEDYVQRLREGAK